MPNAAAATSGRRKRNRRNSDDSNYRQSSENLMSDVGDDGYQAMEGNTTPLMSLLQRVMKITKESRDICGRLINDERVQVFIIVLIIINAIMMGVATFDFVTDDPEINDAFETVDFILLIIFTVELGMQFIYHLWHLFTDGWLLFDFIIIMMSWVFSDIQIIRSFRIFRALRLITRIEVMKNLVSALLSVVPKIIAIIVLLCLIFYIFSVMFTSLFKELYDDGFLEYDYFGTIWDSLFTCYQFMTLDDWNPIAREVMAEKSWAWFPFISFIIISGFVVINLMIAVICDAVAALQDMDKMMLQGGFIDDADRRREEPQSDRERVITVPLIRSDSNGSNNDTTIEVRGGNEPQSPESNPVTAGEQALSSVPSRSPLPPMKKKDSLNFILSRIKSERESVKTKVELIEAQIEELMNIQLEMTREIEEATQRLLKRSDISVKTEKEDIEND